MTLPAELKNSEESSDPTPTMILWASKWKSRPNQVQELIKNDTNETVTDIKPTEVSRKTCICFPTNHAGSFRCRLHRTITVQKSAFTLEENKTAMVKVDSTKMNKHGNSSPKVQLPRFGRSAAVPSDNDGFATSN